MTSKEKLRILIDRLTESEAAALLEQLEHKGAPVEHRPLSFTAIGRSGCRDLGSRSEEVLRDKFPSG